MPQVQLSIFTINRKKSSKKPEPSASDLFPLTIRLIITTPAMRGHSEYFSIAWIGTLSICRDFVTELLSIAASLRKKDFRRRLKLTYVNFYRTVWLLGP